MCERGKSLFHNFFDFFSNVIFSSDLPRVFTGEILFFRGNDNSPQGGMTILFIMEEHITIFQELFFFDYPNIQIFPEAPFNNFPESLF